MYFRRSLVQYIIALCMWKQRQKYYDSARTTSNSPWNTSQNPIIVQLLALEHPSHGQFFHVQFLHQNILYPFTRDTGSTCNFSHVHLYIHIQYFFLFFSALSGYLNSLSGMIYEDFLKEPLAKKGIKNVGLVLKMEVVVLGVIATLLVYVVEHLGGILSVAISLLAIANGPLLGVFLLGLFFPRANSKVYN